MPYLVLRGTRGRVITPQGHVVTPSSLLVSVSRALGTVGGRSPDLLPARVRRGLKRRVMQPPLADGNAMHAGGLGRLLVGVACHQPVDDVLLFDRHPV